MGRLVLLRHGESQWNLENRFTGWVDVPLSSRGIQEAKNAGEKLRAYRFDRAFTSVLQRANETLRLALEVIGQTTIPTERDKALNERMYGELQGLNKAETAKKYGEDQVKIWRRSYDIPPPPLATAEPSHPSHDRRYANVPAQELPSAESLKDTLARVLPFWQSRIAPELKSGRNVLVAAHGNSLRAMVKMLDNMSESQIVELNIPTGVPLLYELDRELKPVASRYLGDPEAIAAAAEAVRRQTEKR